MDRLAQMRLFVRVMERFSFSAAAADLAMPRSTATTAIRDLEASLGAKLLQRTTRNVVATQEGEAYYRRCVTILADVDDAESELAGNDAKGLIRVGMNGPIARNFILPALPTFLDRYPDVTVQMGEGDRYVDVIREGYDCVVRAGEVADSELTMRKVGSAAEVTLASPGYLDRYGTPMILEDLDEHMMVGFSSSRTGRLLPLEFTVGDRLVFKTLRSRICVTSAESYAASGRRGLGLIQAPRYGYVDDIEAGTLVEVLPQHPPSPLPICILYPATRQLASRVRTFINWLADTIAPQLA